MKHQTKPSFTLIGRSILIEGTTVHEQHYSKEKTAFYAQLFKEGMLGKLMPHSLDKKGYALIVPHKDGIQYLRQRMLWQTTKAFSSQRKII